MLYSVGLVCLAVTLGQAQFLLGGWQNVNDNSEQVGGCFLLAHATLLTLVSRYVRASS